MGFLFLKKLIFNKSKISKYIKSYYQDINNADMIKGIITSENTEIVSKRANKLKVDFLIQGAANRGKLDAIKEICGMPFFVMLFLIPSL